MHVYKVKAVTLEQNKSSRISAPRSGSTSAAMRSHQKRDSRLQSSTSIRASPIKIKEQIITPIKQINPMIDNMALKGRCISIWHSHKLNEAHDHIVWTACSKMK
ncbi:hypothetical protein Tco_1462681, partial [Tanacetum coccineum]